MCLLFSPFIPGLTAWCYHSNLLCFLLEVLVSGSSAVLEGQESECPDSRQRSLKHFQFHVLDHNHNIHKWYWSSKWGKAHTLSGLHTFMQLFSLPGDALASSYLAFKSHNVYHLLWSFLKHLEGNNHTLYLFSNNLSLLALNRMTHIMSAVVF